MAATDVCAGRSNVACQSLHTDAHNTTLLLPCLDMSIPDALPYGHKEGVSEVHLAGDAQRCKTRICS